MGLEDFKSEDAGSKSEDEYNGLLGDVSLDSINDDEVDRNILRLVKEIQNTSKGQESAVHYNTKIRAGIALAKKGYKVHIDHEFIDENRQTADVCASWPNTKLNNEKPEDLHYENLIVEVGEYSASRAKEAINHVDSIILVPEGENLDGSLVITESEIVSSDQSDISDVFTDILESSMYIDTDGVPFTPETQDIYVDRYKEIAAIIIDVITDASNMSKGDIIRVVNENSATSYSDNDILKVAAEVGFI